MIERNFSFLAYAHEPLFSQNGAKFNTTQFTPPFLHIRSNIFTLLEEKTCKFITLCKLAILLLRSPLPNPIIPSPHPPSEQTPAAPTLPPPVSTLPSPAH